MTDLARTLGSLPPFEALDDEQLAWLASRGTVERLRAGSRLFAPGPEQDAALWILIEGELVVLRVMGNRELEGARSSQPGAWAGVPPGAVESIHGLTARVARDSTMFRIPRADVEEMIRRGFPIATHFVAGMARGTRAFEAIAQQQEKLESLGKLAAGLAHELNNPAAAARRATEEVKRLLERLAEQSPAGEGLHDLLEEGRALPSGDSLRPLERSDREQRVSSWLRDHGVPDPWELGPELVDAGIDDEWLEAARARIPTSSLTKGLGWLSATLAAHRLLEEIDQSVGRISDLVREMKEYSYMDRTPVQDVDLRRSLQTTLTILKHKLAGIDVELDLPDDLPLIEANGSELNVVWTNLLDNAADALNGSGHIEIRGRVENDEVVTEVVDDGPGIPEEIKSRIFDAFFTTKEVGRGIGLGLETTRRIVANHSGEIAVRSRPGETCFTVRLPIRRRERLPLGEQGLADPDR
jgi:signal transduction histidine kinase